MRTDELDYALPQDLIATEPPAERDGGRLMVLDRRGVAAPEHRRVRDLVELIPGNSLLVVNDTKVIPARLMGRKPTGGRVEVFLLRALDTSGARWTAFGRANKSIRAGAVFDIADGFSVRVDGRDERGVLTVTLLPSHGDGWRAIESHGEVPLPPYMHRSPRPEDRERYQTVFARERGAVAAPTAGLHLSESMLAAMTERGIERVAVTLHVGAGTFAPVETDDLDRHPMHREFYRVPPETAAAVQRARSEGRPIVAVGTTVVRTLESWALNDAALEGETALLIQPGYRFALVDQLLTNFHLPRSTLIALVMAFASPDYVRRAYADAVAARYRFYSYGDAMLLR